MSQQTTTIDPTLLVAQSGWVRSLASHLVRDPDGAEDVAQETLLAALASPPKDAADAKRLRAWLGRVAFNLAHLSRRRNSRRRAREERAARGEREHSAAESYVNDSLDGLVVEAVRALEEPYRTTVRLRYFEGLSTAEVARLTETTNSAVRKRLWRARGKLRRELDHKHNGERQAWFRALAPLAPAPLNALRTAESAGASASSALAVGTLFKIAAALPLLALGVASGRALLERADGAREVAAAPVGLSPAAGPVAGRIPVALEDPGLDSGRGPDERPQPDANTGPRVRVGLLGVESGPPVRETRAAAPVSGYVVDLWGNPLGGVSLVDPRAPADVLGTSAANGSFSLSGLALPVTLEMRAPGYTTLHGQAVGPGEQIWSQWIVAAPAVSLAGSVVDEHGLPMAGAVVEVVFDETAFVELPVLVDLTGALPPRTTTDELGRFALDQVPSGAGISLRVRHPLYGAHLRSVPALSELALLVTLVPRTDLAPLAGVVLDEDQRPLAGVQILVGELSTTTDETGTFSVLVEQQQRSSLRAFKDGYLPSCLECGTRQRVRVVLSTADRAVLGQVVDEEGQPLAGWLVFATPEGTDAFPEVSNPWTESGGTEVGPTFVRTDAGGGFRIGGLGDRDYALTAVDPETLLVTEPRDVHGQIRGDLTRVRLIADMAQVSAVLPGRVLARDGTPLPGASVRAELMIATERGVFRLAGASAHTSEHGGFELSRVARNARLYIEHPSAPGSYAAAVATRPGEAREYVLDLPASVRFSGPADAVAVLDAAGLPLALRGFTGRQTLAPLVRGRSAILAVGQAACTVVWYEEGAEVGRDEISVPTVTPGQELPPLDVLH